MESWERRVIALSSLSYIIGALLFILGAFWVFGVAGAVLIAGSMFMLIGFILERVVDRA